MAVNINKVIGLILHSNLSDSLLDQILKDADLGILDLDFIKKNSLLDKDKIDKMLA